MGDPIKKATVFSVLETHEVELICVQETHLTNDTKSQFRSKKFRNQYHSVHSSYSRGVSILVKRGVLFSCREVSIDALGCYIFLNCLTENKPYVLANVYIPPLFKLEIMYRLLEFVEDKVDTPIIVVGDFNALLNSSLDRFPPGARTDRASEGRLGQFLEEIGWSDLWRSRNPISNILVSRGHTLHSPI